jgi:hypothetical protein
MMVILGAVSLGLVLRIIPEISCLKDTANMKGVQQPKHCGTSTTARRIATATAESTLNRQTQLVEDIKASASDLSGADNSQLNSLVKQIMDHLTAVFGFQPDNATNQREHLLS